MASTEPPPTSNGALAGPGDGNKKRTVLLSVGTRAEIIKMAPVHMALKRLGARPLLLHSGQQVEAAAPLYEMFDMVPDRVIVLVRERPSLGDLSAELLARTSRCIEEMRPDAVLVQGDTTTALASALAAFYAQVPVGHVEAGLRTFDRRDPFPEECNRTLIARLADWHFAPTARARANLHCEGVCTPVHVTGSTAVDAARWALRRLKRDPQHSGLPPDCPLPLDDGRPLLLVAVRHRPNRDAGLVQIARGVRRWLLAHPECAVAWPVHPNPVVSGAVRSTFADVADRLRDRLWLCPPVDYLQLLALLSRSWLVLTDSGGIQEAAAAVGRPVLVPGRRAERPEIVESGRAVLVGADADGIEQHLQRLHEAPEACRALLDAPNPFGDGHAADRIARILLEAFGDLGHSSAGEALLAAARALVLGDRPAPEPAPRPAD